MPLAASIALAITTVLTGTNAAAVQSAMPAAQSVEQYVRVYFADAPVMVAIAKCESRFRQFDSKGSVLRGEVVKDDLGVMQVNLHYHGDVAERLGLDLYTIQGNVAYARYLYEKEGTTPWASSSACWKKSKEFASAK